MRSIAIYLLIVLSLCGINQEVFALPTDVATIQLTVSAIHGTCSNDKNIRITKGGKTTEVDLGRGNMVKVEDINFAYNLLHQEIAKLIDANYVLFANTASVPVGGCIIIYTYTFIKKE